MAEVRKEVQRAEFNRKKQAERRRRRRMCSVIGNIPEREDVRSSTNRWSVSRVFVFKRSDEFRKFD